MMPLPLFALLFAPNLDVEVFQLVAYGSNGVDFFLSTPNSSAEWRQQTFYFASSPPLTAATPLYLYIP
jgi:hypothetical protein